MNNGYIIEDHPLAQQWLKESLEAAFPGIVTEVAATVEEANALLDMGYPDIALVDLNLPDGSGIEVISRLNTESPTTATIVATIYDDDEHLFPALRAGANGYILKEQRKEEISSLLQGIVNGEPPLSPGISHRLLNYFSSMESQMPAQEVEAHDLTKRELDVLSVIAQGHSLNDATSMLGVSRNTIATHVKNIYSKLNITSRAEAALAASAMGILGSE
ncbi:MAG: response regulator transcription factor [Gammaproteobacteria bacterium]|nr:response regulator transcription factor [Gammaproteobacteria bacterium]MCW8982698.1 response regulator transcription factor [Gammaproteobacteria bacterium]